MALSSCSDWPGTLQNLNPEMSTFQIKQEELARDVLGYCDTLDFPNTFFDPLFYTDELLFPENYTHLLPDFISPCDPLLTLSPEIFLHDQDFDSYPYPKRQKCFENVSHFDCKPNSLEGFVPNSYLVPEFLPEFLPELFTPSPEFQIPQVCFYGNDDNARKSNDGGVSAQSIAARQRRRKITEKTQELGMLIPGGNKMNTAEMLQGAFKYVKYLQAQVGILQFMGSIQECKGTAHVEELQVLASSTVQEKLYLEEKCLVPIEFVRILTKHHDIKSKPSISNDLNQLIQFKD